MTTEKQTLFPDFLVPIPLYYSNYLSFHILFRLDRKCSYNIAQAMSALHERQETHTHIDTKRLSIEFGIETNIYFGVEAHMRVAHCENNE